jgi:hypothetical protein
MARVGERASSVVFCLDFQQKGIIFLLTGVSVRQTQPFPVRKLHESFFKKIEKSAT